LTRRSETVDNCTLTVLSFAQLADGLEQVKSTLEATESVGRVI